MFTNSKSFCFIAIIFAVSVTSVAQQLKVTQSSDTRKVDRNASNGIATIVIDSKVNGLTVDDKAGDELTMPNDNLFVFRIDTKRDEQLGFEVSQRIFLLNSPKSEEYPLEIDEILPNTVMYYTVVLPDQFPPCLTVEYLFTKSSKVALRVAFGKRIGFFLGYKWGDYLKAGADIDDVNADYNVTRAVKLGYIRTAITGGLRVGLLHKNNFSVYMLIGGGYGEYGRQWQNPSEIDGNIYFYTDYIKGFDGEMACQMVVLNWINLSIGTDLVVGGGNISVDYQLGAGLNFNLQKIFKRKIKNQ